jgi:hypothetical protein
VGFHAALSDFAKRRAPRKAQRQSNYTETSEVHCVRGISIFLAVSVVALTSVPASSEPLVWFAALDPLQRPEVGYGGSPQYMDLFSPDAPWQQAASHVRVYKIYPQWISQASDAELRRQFTDLKRRGIALALEAGPMTASGSCGKGEGYGGPSLVNWARRIQQDGGTLSYVAMDEPIFFGTLYSGHNACHWTPEQAVAAAAPNLKALLAVFPEVKIGDIEPLGDSPLDTTLDYYRRGMEAFERALGVPLAFFHADIAWWLPGFPGNLIALHKVVVSQHVPFGVIYNGNPNDSSDLTWLQSAEIHMEEAEREIGTPDHVIFQSWNRYPQRLLPEDAPDAFTHLIDAYFRTRTNLTMAISSGELSGKLTTTEGNPIAGAKVQVLLTPLSPKEAMGTLVATGTIPPGTTDILFGIRVNVECGCSGSANVQVAEFRFQPQNGKVTVSTFQKARSDTVIWGNITDLKGASVGGVRNGVLRMAVRRGQQVMMNSTTAPEHAQGSFTFSIKAYTTPDSAGSGYFAVFFMQGGHELSRTMVKFGPAILPVGTAQTGPDGSWSALLREHSSGAIMAFAQYAGDDKHWPAQSKVTKEKAGE